MSSYLEDVRFPTNALKGRENTQIKIIKTQIEK